MNGYFVLQGNDPEYTPSELIDRSPESIAVVFLWLTLYRILDNPDTPLFLDIRPLAQDFVFEIVGEFVLHRPNRLRIVLMVCLLDLKVTLHKAPAWH